MTTYQISEALSRLEVRRLDLALSSLEQPSSRTEFGYGVACGLCQGLSEARQIIQEMLDEADKAEEAL